MLVNLAELLTEAQKGNYAVGGFNTTNYESLTAVLEAAEETGSPVILSHAQAHEPFANVETFGALMVQYARQAKVPVSVHLDHGSDYDYVMRAVRVGFSSIMYDCAQYDLEENIRRVAKFTEMAHKLGISVEAEVGHMPSNIVGQGGCTQFGCPIEHLEDYFTQPEEAAAFSRRTGCDALTVSFGTVHGVYVEKPVLDIQRLSQINSQTACPLVMHGTSGVDDAQILEAINHGVRKFNFYTGMGTAPSAAIQNLLCAAQAPVYTHEISALSKRMMKEVVMDRMRLFQNKA